MTGQSHKKFCGPASIANAIRSFGYSRDIAEAQVAKKIMISGKVSDRNPAEDGVDEQQILHALTAYKLEHEEADLAESSMAIAALRGWLVMGCKVILCVDGHGHWITAIGMGGLMIIVADSADSEITLCLTDRELADRWKRPGDPPSHYAIVIHPRTRRKK